jgi:UDP-N-acetylmuramoylalanine--D-glutamate ligase
MSAFAGERAVVIGAGASGRAAARVLVEEGAEVRVSESGPAPEDGDLSSLGVTVHAGGHRAAHLDGATLVVTSPGVPQGSDVLRWAQERALPVWSELELGARLCDVPYVAVTGTNGKTTTTEMVAATMRAAGLDAAACGNIGHPFSLAAREGHQALAVEASSFQLRFSESLHPRVSVLLNLAEDHLDWHGAMKDYVEAKSRIFARQEAGDVHVGCRDDERAAAVSRTAPCHVVWFTICPPREGEVGLVAGELIARLDEEIPLGMPQGGGSGVYADAAAAAAAALEFGLDPRSVATGLAEGPSLPHRGQTVAAAGGITFVDDSKATNPHATLAALRGRREVVLIAGGLSKGIDLSPLAGATDRLAAVVAIGAAGPEIVELFAGRVPTRSASSIEEATRMAFELAPTAGTVLLAPACASQDQFRDYRERGERFAAAAVSIQQEVMLRGRA